MTESFDQAALRHWSDAQLLGEARMPNSDQLLGFAAECALKSALVQLPAFVDDAGQLNRNREHIDVLWDRLTLQSLQKRFPALMAYLRAPKGNPFADWSVEQRYFADGAVASDAYARHRNAARRLLGAVGLLGVRVGGSRDPV